MLYLYKNYSNHDIPQPRWSHPAVYVQLAAQWPPRCSSPLLDRVSRMLGISASLPLSRHSNDWTVAAAFLVVLSSHNTNGIHSDCRVNWINCKPDNKQDDEATTPQRRRGYLCHLDGLLWPWTWPPKSDQVISRRLVNIPSQFYQNCSSRSWDIVVTNEWTNERTNERGGWKAWRHNAPADTDGSWMHKNE